MVNRIEMLPGEVWYGLSVDDGFRFPMGRDDSYVCDMNPYKSENQAAFSLVSNKGRYIWYGGSGRCTISAGEISLAVADVAEVKTGDSDGSLRGAFLASATHWHTPAPPPPAAFFAVPQYNTWIELMYDQTAEGVLGYAKSLLQNGYPPGVLMIDDNWMLDYGNWQFHLTRFPDPAACIRQLHDMGFTVMLWVCPFVSPDSPVFRALENTPLLLRDKEGEIAIRNWWNGYSAVLDMTHPEAADWLYGEFAKMQNLYGIDGFKLDAGDGKFYRNDDRCFSGADANGQTQAWMEFGKRFAFNEFRASFGGQGWPLVQRLADKKHAWDTEGLGSVVPNALAQGILGYPYGCPDMIGGGQYGSFLERGAGLDEELFVRYAQAASLMPMMQYSAAPWRVLGEENAAQCLAAAKLHLAHAETIQALARHAGETGEPIIRYMEYVFPHQGFEKTVDQYMLGDSILVAPILEKGLAERPVRLPAGDWQTPEGETLRGPACITSAALYFTRN